MTKMKTDEDEIPIAVNSFCIAVQNMIQYR